MSYLTSGAELAAQFRALADAVEGAGDLAGCGVWTGVHLQVVDRGEQAVTRSAAVDRLALALGMLASDNRLRSGSVHHSTPPLACSPVAPAVQVTVYTDATPAGAVAS